MGTDNFTFGPGEIYITDHFGDTIMEAPVYNMTCDFTLSADADVNYEFECTTSASDCVINRDLFDQLAGQPSGYYLEYYADIQVQARRHRKKRIDKKWLKRYGYKTVRRKVRLRCDQLTIMPDDDGLGVRFDAEGVQTWF